MIEMVLNVGHEDLKRAINKAPLTKQQKRTLLGQVKAGHIEGAERGLKRLLKRLENNNNTYTESK